MNALIFIDTNILLDFYRIRGSDSGLSVLEHIDSNHSKIITGNQIEMEFKKNRQKVILESLGRIKPPDWAGLSPAAFMSEAQPAKMIAKSKKELIKQQKNLKQRLEKVLKNAVQNDRVYQCLQRLFKNGSELNLDRDKRIRKRIRSLAWKRFILGYPPRKKDDTSMGDAVNWEWIVQCAIDSGKDIIIASRDSDYGATYNDEPLLNDALHQEFKERVSKRRKIVLTDKLTEAFKRASIAVTKKEEKQEQDLLDEMAKKRVLLAEWERIAMEEAKMETAKIADDDLFRRFSSS